MEKNLEIGLLLVDINKTDMQLLLCLNLLFKHNKLEDRKAYRLRDIANMTGLTSIVIAKSLNNLSNKNIVGKLVFEEGLVDRKIIQNFEPCFLAILGNVKNPIKVAVKRVGYHIIDGNVVYILNPIISSWKFPGKRKIGKTLKVLDENIDSEFLKVLLESQKNGKSIEDNKINGWSIKSTIMLFCEKYKINYGAIYSPNWARDYKTVKHLLEHLKTNNMPKDRLEDFLDYAFTTAKQVKNKKLIVSIPGLKYYANQYITNVVKSMPKVSEFYRDEEGNLRKKKKA